MLVVTSDGLDTPLDQGYRKQPLKLPTAIQQILAGLLGPFVIAMVAGAMFVNDPLGGEPTAVATTDSITEPPAKPDTDNQHVVIPGQSGAKAQ